VSINTMRALLGGALLLVAGACFADEWPDQYSAGPDAKKEFAALSENGRAAYKRALIACSLYADEHTINYKADCKTAIEAFTLEFDQAKFIPFLFRYAIISTEADQTNTELYIHGMGARPPIHDNPGKASITALEKIYHDGSIRAATTSPARSPLNIVTASPARPASKTAGDPILIPLQRQGGTFVVPVQINKAITLNFVVDSGASDVSIPADVVSTLLRTGTLQKGDFIGTETYKLADGSKAPSATFRIRSLTATGVEIRNVKASVAPGAGELLLGQSFLSRFKSWSIDNARQALVLTVRSTEQMTGMPDAPLTPTGDGYVVHVSSRLSEEEAQSSFRDLQAKYPDLLGGRTAIIRRADLGAKGIFFRALVGPFASADQATELCSNLKAAGGSCLVLPETHR
jgi:clan AA aspartic protease (TIGR02281 family)